MIIQDEVLLVLNKQENKVHQHYFTFAGDFGVTLVIKLVLLLLSLLHLLALSHFFPNTVATNLPTAVNTTRILFLLLLLLLYN